MNQETAFPQAILSVSRQEYYQQENDPAPDSHRPPLELEVKTSTGKVVTLPSDLKGAVFIVAPVGSVNSIIDQSREDDCVLPAKRNGTPLLNGDGMMYRLDFQDGKATFSSRFVNTLSRYVDKILREHPDKPEELEHLQELIDLKFINSGIARMSPLLGAANQVNTAFLQVKFKNSENPRLLATWDAGIPQEIDPKSLQVIAPVGRNKDWNSLIKLPKCLTSPFKQLMTSAHPVCDYKTGEMFDAHVVRSLSTFLWFSRTIPFKAAGCIAKLPKWMDGIADFLLFVYARIIALIFGIVFKFLELFNIGSGDHLYLMRWQGGESLETWKVVLENYPHGPAIIRQTIHQIGLTEDYIILADTSFKIVLSSLLPALKVANLFSKTIPAGEGITLDREEARHRRLKALLEILRKLFNHPQANHTNLYIIDRKDLNAVAENAPLKDRTVKAKKVTLKTEFSHFLTDYKNPDGKITLHAAVTPATDPAEFIHNSDRSVFGKNKALQEMAGMLNDALHVNYPTLYEIDGKTGREQRQEKLPLEQAQKNTWYLALYTYPDRTQAQQIREIYAMSFGAWTNLLSEFVYSMYKNYPQDLAMPLERILEKTRQGVPATLSRIQIDRTAPEGEVLSISDSYPFPQGYFASSPQYVPGAAERAYIVCTVVLPTIKSSSEIWIFDAHNLKDGPQYRLGHPSLKLGFTLHTTWMERVTASPARPYDVEADFQTLVSECIEKLPSPVRKKVEEIFKEAYKQYNRDRKSTETMWET